MVAPVAVSPVVYRGGFRPDQYPPGGGVASHYFNFLSVCIIQTGVLWPTAAAFYWFATVSVADVPPFLSVVAHPTFSLVLVANLVLPTSPCRLSPSGMASNMAS